MPGYQEVQFIGFEITPATRPEKDRNPSSPTYGKKVEQYIGDTDASDDIEARCKVMKAAIRTAYKHPATHKSKPKNPARGVLNTFDKGPVLTVFMAPEFYFRDKDGAYPIDKMHEIMDHMRKEVEDDKYKDWLFVYGTAIGYMRHEGTFTQENPDTGEDTILYRKRIEATSADTTGKTTVTVSGLPHSVWTKAAEYADARIRNIERVMNADAPTSELKITLERVAGFSVGKQVCFFGAGVESKEKRSFAIKAVDGASITIDYPPIDPCPTDGCRCKAHVKHAWRPRLCGSCGHTHVHIDKGHIATQLQPLQVVKVTGVKDVGVNRHTLTLQSTTPCRRGNYVDLQSGTKKGATEVFNVALVQKGGKAPPVSTPGLRHVLVYKEFTSHIDYIEGRGRKDDFYKPGGRIIKIHQENRVVLPTAGADDQVGGLGQTPNKPGTTVQVTGKDGTQTGQKISEINRSGMGGGGVFEIDGITFGLEVCRDHLVDRLIKFYDNNAETGDPKVQIQLVPSWGAWIKDCCCVEAGPIFNVDGPEGSHLEVREDGGGTPARPKYFCAAHKATSSVEGNCPHDHAVCDCSDVTEAVIKQGIPSTDWHNYACQSCGKSFRIGTGALRPSRRKINPVEFVTPSTGSAKMTKLDVELDTSVVDWDDYFENEGTIVVYPKQPIPPAEKVT